MHSFTGASTKSTRHIFRYATNQKLDWAGAEAAIFLAWPSPCLLRRSSGRPGLCGIPGGIAFGSGGYGCVVSRLVQGERRIPQAPPPPRSRVTFVGGPPQLKVLVESNRIPAEITFVSASLVPYLFFGQLPTAVRRNWYKFYVGPEIPRPITPVGGRTAVTC
jgi:hypothetical protein